MSDETDARWSVPRVQPIAELFTTAATALWATTYSLDLSLFNEFLLPRLGEPPLNVVVLADQRRLDVSLTRLPVERVDSLALTNRRWLLRGVPTVGAFHPKSYLAVTGNSVTLLLGSGNLSLGGLDDGLEVFTLFRSGTSAGDAAIASWRSWLRRVVSIVGDTTLAERFAHLEQHLPAHAPSARSPLLHNLDKPLADQLFRAVGADSIPVDELWLTAPFYDAEATAFGSLLDQLKPKHVRLFVTGLTSVTGERLVERLTASGASVDVAAYEPDGFVHAKLIGVIAGSRGWLLSGSANLSSAALTLTPSNLGNIELAVLADLDPDLVRAAFEPPDKTVRACDLDHLATLGFRSEADTETPELRLIAAASRPDGHVEVTSDPPVWDGVALDDRTLRQPLVPASDRRAVTAGPLPGRLVRLVNETGRILSNEIVVDDPLELAAALVPGSAQKGHDLPPEFTATDLDSPLAERLAWLHRHLVMDVNERATGAASSGIVFDETDDDGDQLWERLEREQLARDPRAQMYQHLWSRHLHGSADPIIELLDSLGVTSPIGPESTRQPSILARLLDNGVQREDDAGDGDIRRRRWTLTARVRVRARNLLRRWTAAQSDPRLVWVNPHAPAVNFEVIAAVLAGIHLDLADAPDRVELTADDLDDLWWRLLRSVVGAGNGDGWLERQPGDEQRNILKRLTDSSGDVAAGLCWLALQTGTDRRERIVAAQPIIIAALDRGLLDPTEETVRFITVTASIQVTRQSIERDLLEAACFIDDGLWCARTSSELGLEDLTLRVPPGAAAIQIRVDVGGIADPLHDSRVPRLVVAARRYRNRDGVALYASDAAWRLTFIPGEAVAYLPQLGEAVLESTTLGPGVLEALSLDNGTLAHLFPAGS